MTPSECQAIALSAQETFSRAQDMARVAMELQAMATELTVIAVDLCSWARAERERARLQAHERGQRNSRTNDL